METTPDRLDDVALEDALMREDRRQREQLMLVASSSLIDGSVLRCLSSRIASVTAEGYPSARYHAGCVNADSVERLAIQRAKGVFGASYANVQPHSASTANYSVLGALLDPGDRILGMDLSAGGHLTHGSPPTFSGQHFTASSYGVNREGVLDYDHVRRVAMSSRPRLIICGATAYPRRISFESFRDIAADVDAYLLADISHIAGLVAADLHSSPIGVADVTTTCTHKQIGGPRGGLILAGSLANALASSHASNRDLASLLQKGVFPFFQGAPMVNVIAAKARAFGLVRTQTFRSTAERICNDARVLAECLQERGYTVVSGGTDNHIVLLDLTRQELTGRDAERWLEDASIIVNKNPIPGDVRPPSVASGIRIGTNTVAQRGMGTQEMHECARLIDQVLQSSGRSSAIRDARQSVVELCRAFPLPDGMDADGA